MHARLWGGGDQCCHSDAATTCLRLHALGHAIHLHVADAAPDQLGGSPGDAHGRLPAAGQRA
jgi:hypothetical protein